MDTKYSRLQNFLNESKTNDGTDSNWSLAKFSTNFNRAQRFFGKSNSSNGDSTSSNSDDFQNMLEKADHDPILPSLTRKQRILGFMLCLSMGILCICLASLYTPVLLIKGRKFALLFSFGSVFFLGSFSMLWGPMNHLMHLIHVDRLPFTVTYLVTLVTTIYFSVWAKSTIFTLVFAILQVVALLWYVISYIPGGSTGLKFFSKLFYAFVSKGVSSTLSV